MERSLTIPGGIQPHAGRSPWIHGPAWDMGWLIGSAAIVPVVLFFVWRGNSSEAINLGVTALIGGPHLFATYTATFLDPRFRRSHLWLLLASALLVPAFVAYWTLVNFQILLSVFIFAASVHVLHQNAYLTDIYRKRAGHPEPLWSRLTDYGLLMISIYPIAAYKLVHSNFLLGDVQILIPSFLMVPFTYWAVWVVFAVFLSAWIRKTATEYRQGRLNGPKTLLIGVTTAIVFFVPLSASGERLELAFQSVNAWHSIQYLGLVWYIQKVRKERGLIDSRLVAGICGGGRAAWYFYGFCLLVTLALFGLLVGGASLDPLHLTFQQYYYMGVLSCLLIHYVLDGYLFTISNRAGAQPEQIPFAVLSAA
ncbi:MAG TPA: hypothetical protein VLH58_00925 [Candidatus Methylomirabilis sp.]|nr:hypothetical protein [Candidatus Methylomirabilis sp.]HSD52048.1 hypothetical protein [Candidatus Methylomirabilis sp.]